MGDHSLASFSDRCKTGSVVIETCEKKIKVLIERHH
jgi:hypothetical protein